ncbi:MAG: hypothetical protein Q8L49_07750 [Burkholderiaceae bacterium]|nr:hypothetical protein [Burkholderiaceae bacterium]
MQALASGAGPLRCRFSLFHRDKLAYGDDAPMLAPKYMAPGSDCRLVELSTAPDAPYLGIEVAVPNLTRPGVSVVRETRCKLRSVTLYGPRGLPLLSHDTLRTAM